MSKKTTQRLAEGQSAKGPKLVAEDAAAAVADAAPTTILSVPLDSLEHDPVAVEGHEQRLKSLDDLLASLPLKGQLQSLKVRPSPASDVHSDYWVTAGNRRLAALRALQKAGGSIKGVKVTGAFPVHVIVSAETDADAYESSRSENLQRLPETPVEEFRAFAKMAKTKSVKDIAAVFGCTAKRVEQRLRLAALHEDVLAALEAGKITMEAAQAFSVEPNPQKQAAYLKKNAKNGWALSPGQVKQAFTEKLVRSDSPIAKLIGKDAYVAAGGQILGDAFSGSAYWISPDVIDRLAEERMKDQKVAWLEEGWSFAESADEYLKGAQDYLIYRNRLQPLGEPDFGANEKLAAEAKSRLAELVGEYPALSQDDIDPSIPQDIDEEYQKLTDELDDLAERQTFTAEQKAIAGVVYWPDGRRAPEFGIVREGTAVPKGLGGDDDEGDDGADLRDPGWDAETAIFAMKSKTLGQVLADNSTLALRVLVAQLRFGQSYSGVLGVSRSFKSQHQGYSDFASAYADVRDLESAALVAELAEMVAAGVSISRHVDTSQLFADASGPAFKFDGKAYFSHLSKPLLRAAWADMWSPDTIAPLDDGDLKAMAKVLVKAAQATGWLPPQLRTPAYSGPKFVTGDAPDAAADNEGEELVDADLGEDNDSALQAAE